MHVAVVVPHAAARLACSHCLQQYKTSTSKAGMLRCLTADEVLRAQVLDSDRGIHMGDGPHAVRRMLTCRGGLVSVTHRENMEACHRTAQGCDQCMRWSTMLAYRDTSRT